MGFLRSAHATRAPTMPTATAIAMMTRTCAHHVSGRVRRHAPGRGTAAGFRYHAEQCREQGPVRPVQLAGARSAYTFWLCDGRRLPRASHPARAFLPATMVLARQPGFHG